jgi:predicted esterase
VRRLLDELAAEGGYRRDAEMVGGFSQGAMVAAEIAFATDEPLPDAVTAGAEPFLVVGAMAGG